jgi:RNA polymerase sigma-70 factor, ECF subfamily
MESSGDITKLLQQAQKGDTQALNDVVPLVYGVLKRLAVRQMAQEARGHTLTPTALVHEAWLQIAHADQLAWPDRHRFYAYAAKAMRSILVDHARARSANKRGGDVVQIALQDQDAESAVREATCDELIALDQALKVLNTLHPRAARVIELKFFAGLSLEEIAVMEQCNERTVRRDFALAKAMLADALAERPNE